MQMCRIGPWTRLGVCAALREQLQGRIGLGNVLGKNASFKPVQTLLVMKLLLSNVGQN